jgi:hypothetical protein
MIWLYAYLAIGFVFLIGLTVWAQLDRENRTYSLLDGVDLSEPPEQSFVFWLSITLVVPVVVFFLVVPGWPYFLVARIRETYAARQRQILVEPYRYSVKPEHLEENLTVAEVERREWVDDPLGGAPSLPFGHLNPDWRCFLTKLDAGDELWSFEAAHEGEHGPIAHRTGYVIVRDGMCRDFFVSWIQFWDVQ